ncbi:bromodomain-containing protein 7 [Hydra vulgaris]|uniref:Bromodomain-containing protein 7 n=1 Tax=Hydra vulgaris TaxID=6087 RepID=T2M5I3_HYDVU|nr:bromodomain-containing protein 7 isoform X1 [Hydra vulgaris]
MGKGKKIRESNEEVEEKPLPRLVLKVDQEKKLKDPMREHDLYQKSKRFKEGSTLSENEHTHHKKKRKKHKRARNEESERKQKKQVDTENVDLEPVMKKIHIKFTKEEEKLQKEAEVSPLNNVKVSPLRLCLENLHRNLQRKDIYGIFTNPVTDLIAPGYSKIIRQPMDFQTMALKIERNEYASIESFKDDYIIMCNNAMRYNGSDTIYYKSAEKMLAIGLKMMSKKKLRKLQRLIGKPISDSEDELILVDESSDINIDSYSPERLQNKKKDFEKIKKERDSIKHQTFVNSILHASKMAAKKLYNKYPKQKYGYLMKDSQGNTSLNILNPDTTEDNKTAPVTLGKITGKLTTGITLDQTFFKDEKKSRNIPVTYLLYGPYGSFGPTYDSSLSNMKKEESDLLMQAYGTEEGVEYAKSLLEFCKGNSFLMEYADRLLNTVTDGEHTRLIKQTEPNSLLGTVETKDEAKKLDMDSLLSLNGLGIDVSFLNKITSEKSNSVEKSILAKNSLQKSDQKSNMAPQQLLSNNVELLQNLNKAQNERFSARTLQNVDDNEQSIANSLVDNLKDLVGRVAPKDVVASQGIHKAIGNTAYPLTSEMDNEAASAISAIEDLT